MSLKDKLIQIVPRENSGSNTSNRYDFQKDWGICKLLELHESHQDYVIVFDFHDDILVLSSESEPTKIDFYQVKTKANKVWTLKDLLGKKDKPSIIGNLYLNKMKFEEASSLNIVSNSAYSVSLKDESITSTDSNEICLIELDDDSLKSIKERLKKEHSLIDEPSFEALTFLKVTPLSLNDHAAHTKGKLHDFIENIHPGSNCNVSLLYKELFEDVKRKTNYSSTIKGFDDLVKNKSLSASQFSKILDFALSHKSSEERWRLIDQKIHQIIPIKKLKDYKNAWTTIEVQKMNPNNTIFFTTQEKCKKIVDQLLVNQSSNEVPALIEQAHNLLLAQSKNPIPYSKEVIETIILSCIYE